MFTFPKLKPEEEYCPKCNGFGVTVDIRTEGSFDPSDEETYGVLNTCDECRGTGKRIDKESIAYIQKLLTTLYDKHGCKSFIYPYTKEDNIKPLVERGYVRKNGYTKQGQYKYVITEMGEANVKKLRGTK